MTFKDLNQGRLYFVIVNAVGPILKEFYKKNQKRLIIEGIKIQIIPQDIKKGIELFAHFNEKAILIAEEWFNNHLEIDENISLQDAINSFVSIENDKQNINEDLNAKYSKIIFKELLKKEPDQSLLKFMESEIIKNSKNKTNNESVINFDSSIIENIIKHLDQDNFDYTKLGFYELFFLSIIKNNFDDEIINEARKKASENKINFDICETIISKAKANRVHKKNKTITENNINIIESNQLSYSKEIDIDEILVIGTVTNIVESSGNRFIRILGIIEDGQLYELSLSQKQFIFPDSGDIIWYAKDFKKPLLKSEIGVFKVTPSTIGYTNHSVTTKFAVKEFINKLHQVRICNANDRKNIINWLHINENDIADKHLYVLANNQLIKPHTTTNQKIDFDRPMDISVNSEIFKIEGVYLSHEITSSNNFIDLSSSETYLKKLLKNDEFNQLNLTKSQITRLIEEIKLIKEGQNGDKISEILEDLNELINKQDILQSLINKISESVEVKSAIDEIIKTKSSEELSKKNELVNEIRQLEQQKNNLSKTINVEKEQYKKLKLSFSNDIKDIFQKGIENGRSLLAESAFYQALITNEISNDTNKTNNPSLIKVENTLSNYSISFKKVSNDQFEEKIKSFPYKSVKTKKLLEALFDCCSIGLSIGLKGGASNIIAKLMADYLSNKSQNTFIEFDIRPGVSNIIELSFDEIINSNKMVYLIKNFDIAPISIYGHDMVDICYLRALDNNPDNYPQVIFTFEDSGLGLDIPRALTKSTIIIDLDNPEYEDKDIDLDTFEEYTDESQLDLSEKYFIKKLTEKIKKSEIAISKVRLQSLLGLLDHFYVKSISLK